MTLGLVVFQVFEETQAPGASTWKGGTFFPARGL